MSVLGEEVHSGGQDITEAAAKLCRSMVVSCGSTACKATMETLEHVRGTVSFDSIARIEGYGYRLRMFERLQLYANKRGLEVIDVVDVATYFGGKLHIDIMADHAGHAGLAQFLGEAAGLVTHILLPLDDKTYRNLGRNILFENAYEMNPQEVGVPCFHLGVVVNIPLSQEQVQEILDEQASSQVFVDYLSEVEDVVRVPDKYFYALNCLDKDEMTTKDGR